MTRKELILRNKILKTIDYMKVLKILALVIFIGVLAVFIFLTSVFSGTTWGGWKPPDTSLKLNASEKKWQEAYQKKNDCRFTYIGLDGSYQEDTIIYIELDGKRNSDFVERIATDGAGVTEEICRQFLSSSKTNRPQQYIEVTFYNIKTPTAQYPVSLSFLYARKSGVTQKIEDRRY